MNKNILVSIRWGIKMWLVLFPWQTLLLIRQVSRGGSVWASLGIFVPFSALFLLCLLGLAGVYYRNIWCLAGKKYWLPLTVGFGLVIGICASALDPLIAWQTVFFVLLVCGFIWLVKTTEIPFSEWVGWISVGTVGPIILALIQFFAQTGFTVSWLGISALPSFTSGAPVIVGEWGRWLRASGTFPHPNILAGYLVVVLATILKLSRTEVYSKKIQWWYRFIVIFLTAALLATVSRAGMLAWIILLMVEHWWLLKDTQVRENRLLLFITMTVGMVGVVLLWPLLSGRILIQNSVQELVSVTERIDGMQASYVVWKDHWLFGTGPGNFTVAWADNNPHLAGFALQPVHNSFVLILVEWGVFGVGILFLMGWRLYCWGRNSRSVWLSLAPLIPLLLFDHYLVDIWVGMLIFAIHISSTFYPHLGSTEPKK